VFLALCQAAYGDGCATMCPDRQEYAAVTLSSLAATAGVGDFADVKAIQLSLPSGVSAEVALSANSTGYAENSTSCPVLRSIPEDEAGTDKVSSVGWAFGTPSFDSTSGTLTVPMTWSCPSYAISSAAGSSVSLALAAATFAAAGRDAIAAAAGAAACATGVGASFGEGSMLCSAGCSPWLHLRLDGGPPSITSNSTSMAFTCPQGGCGGASECSTTAPVNRCEVGWVAGRPYTDEHGPVFAPLAKSNRSCWTEPVTGLDENQQRISGAQRREAAQRWRVAALAEHASVASFARASLELMAVGAPADLLAATHEAALDEIRHAKVAFGLAQHFGEDGVAPGPLPVGAVAVATSLPELAARTFAEGCAGETLSVAKAQLELMSGRFLPEEEAALRAVYADEARHAALAWRTVAWALREDPAPVAKVLRDAEAKLAAAQQTTAEKDESSALHREVVQRLTRPWLQSLLAQSNWPPAVDKATDSSLPARAAAETAEEVARTIRANMVIAV
ncbi:unnamed protein product, partial [Symbiodinium pilosum]